MNKEIKQVDCPRCFTTIRFRVPPTFIATSTTDVENIKRGHLSGLIDVQRLLIEIHEAVKNKNIAATDMYKLINDGVSNLLILHKNNYKTPKEEIITPIDTCNNLIEFKKISKEEFRKKYPNIEKD